MGFRMSVPYLGLTRVENEKRRHKGNVRAICLEAGYERVSHSHTLDRTLSMDNVYVGYRSGNELAQYLLDEADSYRVKVKGKTKSGEEIVRERGLRKDAIIGFACIFKPPADVIREWDAETRDRFFADCYDVAHELEPELFAEKNLLMKVRHKDEKLHGGEEHEHVIGIPLTADGHYDGSDMLNHMKRNFNKNFAKCMRTRGWEMDELDLYDPERAKQDEEYRKQRREKRSKQGRSVNTYAADENEKRALEAKQKEVDALQSAAEALHLEKESQERRKENEDAVVNAQREFEIVNAKSDIARESLAKTEQSFENAVSDLQTIKTLRNEYSDEVDKLDVEIEHKRKQSKEIVKKAEKKAERIVEQANSNASEVYADAKRKREEEETLKIRLEDRNRRLQKTNAEIESKKDAFNEGVDKLITLHRQTNKAYKDNVQWEDELSDSWDKLIEERRKTQKGIIPTINRFLDYASGIAKSEGVRKVIGWLKNTVLPKFSNFIDKEAQQQKDTINQSLRDKRQKYSESLTVLDDEAIKNFVGKYGVSHSNVPTQSNQHEDDFELHK